MQTIMLTKTLAKNVIITAILATFLMPTIHRSAALPTAEMSAAELRRGAIPAAEQVELNRKLFLAIHSYDPEGVKRALAQGADPNGQQNDDCKWVSSPLYDAAGSYTCFINKGNVVQALIEAGANLNSNLSMIESATGLEYDNLLGDLAATTQDIAHQLIEAGGDFNRQDCEGNTALMMVMGRAPIKGDDIFFVQRTIRFLIENGADETIKNHKDQTAHDLAREHQAEGYPRTLIALEQALEARKVAKQQCIACHMEYLHNAQNYLVERALPIDALVSIFTEYDAECDPVKRAKLRILEAEKTQEDRARRTLETSEAFLRARAEGRV